MPEQRRRLRRLWIRLAAVAVLIPAAFVGVRWAGGNQGTVIPGQFYRSGQLTGRGISAAIERHGIQTVLNLRGSNPDQPWYRAERAATLDGGATQVDIAMASNLWLSREQARMLVEVLDSCERPALIHCQWGAERTGLVAAIIELLRPGGSLDSARDQFSTYYLFLPIKDGLVMQGHVKLYAGWLAENGLDHSPEVFRRWLTTDYEPGSPSREEWPYDPYPLAVITHPDRGGSGDDPVEVETISSSTDPRDDDESRRR